MKRAASVVRRPAATCLSSARRCVAWRCVAWPCSARRCVAWRCVCLFACLVILLGGWGAKPLVSASDVVPAALPAASDTPLALTVRSEVVDGEMPSLSPPLYRAGIVEYILGNRSRMIQIATLMMLLGLFILMRK